MEIERKFLIDAFPKNLPMIYSAYVLQGYISTDPTVRIRSRRTSDGNEDYELCFKGEGTLVRSEFELEINKDAFVRLEEMLKAPPIVKDYRVYELGNGLKLECSHVDPGEKTAFFYAEVEFRSVEEADAFLPPSFLGKDVTEEPGYTMADYWKRKLSKI